MADTNYALWEAVGSIVGGFATAGTVFGALLAYRRRNRDLAIEQLKQDTSRAVVLVHQLDMMLVEENFTAIGVQVAQRLAERAREKSKAGLVALLHDDDSKNLINFCVYDTLYRSDLADKFEEVLRELQNLSRGQIQQFPLVYSMISDATRMIVRFSSDMFRGSIYIEGLTSKDLMRNLIEELPEKYDFESQTILLGVQIAGFAQIMTRDVVQRVLDACEVVIKVLEDFARKADHDKLESLMRRRREDDAYLKKKSTGSYPGDIGVAAARMRRVLGANHHDLIARAVAKMVEVQRDIDQRREAAAVNP